MVKLVNFYVCFFCFLFWLESTATVAMATDDELNELAFDFLVLHDH